MRSVTAVGFTRKSVLGLAIAVTLVGVACAKSTPTSSGSSPSAPSTGGDNGSGGNPYGGGGRGYGSGGSPSPAAANTVEQGAGGFVFAPTMLTVKTGTSITVQNVGTTAHTFTITSTGIDITNDPGASKPVTINLQPGTYPFFCRFHVNLGMKGTLVVQN